MNYVRHWRKKAGVKVSELAQEMNISEVTLWRWERNKSDPNAAEIKKLCSVLNITEAELLNGPQDEEIYINLKFGPLKEVGKLVIDTNNNNRFELVMSGESLGIAGIAKFKDDEEFENTLSRICNELREGWEFIKNRKCK